MKKVKQYKISRRFGTPLFEKCQSQKFALREQRKKVRRKPVSDYGRQLLEKQKLRFLYNISEKDLKKYIQKADSSNHDSFKYMAELLERRIDIVIYRMGIAGTSREARQMVSHGHITLNGKKVTIPSIQVKDTDIIGIRKGSENAKPFLNLNEKIKNKTNPVKWVSFDLSKKVGSFKGEPVLDEIINLSAVFEFYSR